MNLPTRNVLSRFVVDRYSYREQPSFLPELIVFSMVTVAASWPMAILVTVLAHGK